MSFKAIIDLEFTGLDNTFISDNEIVQFKAMNVETGQVVCKNFNSDKDINAWGFLVHKIKKYNSFSKFTKEEFLKTIAEIGIEKDCTFYGYGTTQDTLMLKKYDINIPIKDLQQMLQLSEYDKTLATEGRGLEEAYYIVTGKIPQSSNHNGTDELFLMKELYDKTKDIKLKEYFDVMPHGHCAGMPLEDYVAQFRRAADGYRYNNNDILSKSLEYYIYESEMEEDLIDEEDTECDDEDFVEDKF